ncbi:MAG: carbamoyltransferase [Planctomycetota bacterium]
MSDPKYILGVSAFYHDSAACLVRDGELLHAAQEERFTRKKHDPDFPKHAIEWCLEAAGIAASDLAAVAFYDKPFVKFERLLQTYIGVAPRGLVSFLKAMPVWLKQKLWMPDIIREALGGYEGPVLFGEHHESHAASAFYPSPFSSAAILTMDGVGEWTTTSISRGEGNRIEILADIRFPHSTGLLYSAFTYYTGFRVNSGEYKLMGLAPYGEPRYVDLIREKLVDLREDGSLRLDMRYFGYLDGLTMTNRRFHRLFGGPPRAPESEVTQREMDIARSIQVVTEEIMLRQAARAHELTGERNLCLAGGVALNCVGNGRILREGPFDEVWIQPAAGDAGGAPGAALTAWHRYFEQPRENGRNGDAQAGSYLGPEYGEEEIRAVLDARGAVYRRLDEEELLRETAGRLASGEVVGWFQGRMEFGPRALGNRSILGDPRSPEMQQKLNLKIKYRESFRPFAPSALEEKAGEWFDLDRPSPYMLLVAPVKEERRRAVSEAGASGLDRLRVVRSEIPAVTHVDDSARIQTVNGETNPLYHRLISEFDRITGCPLVVNTSFNVRGEPIVCTPEDAWLCFTRTEMDRLVIGPFVLDKADQPPPGDDLEIGGPMGLD